MVYERMGDYVKKSGNNIHLNTPVYGIVTVNGKVIGIELEDGNFREYDHVISSMPYTLMVKRLSEVPIRIKTLAENLKFRNTVIVYLLVNSTELFPDNWIYVHSADLLMGRITNFRNWVPGLYNDETKSILAIEYWCNDEDPMWKFSDEHFIELASEETIKTKLVKSGLIEEGYVHRIHRSYPVYKKGYKEILKPIENYLSSIKNLSVIGRYGAFKYNNQDHSILMGLKAADNIANNANHILCEINTDYETYQESYIVTKMGLQKQCVKYLS